MPELNTAPAPGTGIVRNASTGILSTADATLISGVSIGAASSSTALGVGRTTANPALQVTTNIANSVTGLVITARAAAAGVDLSTRSSGTDEDLRISALGTGVLSLKTNGQIGFQVGQVASAVDYLVVTPAATANPATLAITATGSDNNININLVPKGSGTLQYGGAAVALASSVPTVYGSTPVAVPFNGAGGTGASGNFARGDHLHPGPHIEGKTATGVGSSVSWTTAFSAAPMCGISQDAPNNVNNAGAWLSSRSTTGATAFMFENAVQGQQGAWTVIAIAAT